MEDALEMTRSKDRTQRITGMRKLHQLLKASKKSSLSSADINLIVDYCLEFLLTLMEGNEAQEVVELIGLVKATRELLSENVSNKDPAELPSDDSGEPSMQSTSRYKIEFKEVEKLGSGGYGRVFKCLNLLDNMEYAIKMVPLTETADRGKILREVRALSVLQHQHIVRYYQAWIEQGGFTDDSSLGSDGSSSDVCVAVLYIQMELCPMTLKAKMSKEIDRDTVRRYFRQMVEGLHHIHESCIIHRDLSTSNIFLDGHGNIKIGDFGLAKFIKGNGNGSPNTSGTERVGNAMYCAPEMDNERPQISFKVDLYSLGIIFVELLHYVDTEHERVFVIGQAKKGVFPNSFTSKEKSLLTELLALSPLDRPSALDLLDKLKGESDANQTIMHMHTMLDDLVHVVDALRLKRDKDDDKWERRAPTV